MAFTSFPDQNYNINPIPEKICNHFQNNHVNSINNNSASIINIERALSSNKVLRRIFGPKRNEVTGD
jgi:hypothetical protein